jgi:hypothetical protein
MSALMADYGKMLQTTTVYSDFYNVTVERTTNFTVLWDGQDSMTLLALYDWNNHIALDLSANADDFTNGENKIIIENFFWFADEVISVPQEVMECRE